MKGGEWMRGLLSLSCVLAMVLLVVLAVLPAPAEAVALGVNKAKIEFEDVLRNGYAEETFVVSTDSPSAIGGVVEVEGDIDDWVSFKPANATEGFEFRAGAPATITVIIQPPDDAANGQYDGIIRVLTGELARTEGGLIGTSTRAAFKIAALVGITGIEKRACSIGGFQLRNTEIGQPIDTLYSVKNSGNVRVSPRILVEIYDQLEESVVLRESIQTESQVLPTTSDHFLTQIIHDLPPGQYWGRASSDECVGGGSLTFDILERGGIADMGELIRIDAEPWNEVGEIIPIKAIFRNTGSRTVSAKFKGAIFINSKPVKVIDTDFYNTPPGETAEIETFFNPGEPGQYEVRGRVLYNDKLTYERSAIINVRGEALKEPSNTVNVIVVILFILIILLILLIIRKQKRRRY